MHVFGKEATVKITNYNPLGVSKVRATFHYNKDGASGVRKFDYEVEGLKLGKGNVILKRGKIVKGSSSFVEDIQYRYNGRNRLINGFTVLTTQLRISGADPDRVSWCENIFESLTEQDKVAFFRMYNEQTIQQGYSSDALVNPSDVATDSNWYLDTIESILSSISGQTYA